MDFKSPSCFSLGRKCGHFSAEIEILPKLLFLAKKKKKKNSPKPKLNLRSNTNLNAAMFNISCSIYEYFDSKQYYRVKIIRWLLEPYNRIWLVNPSTQILIKTHVWCLKSKKKTSTSFSFFFFFLNWKVWIPRIVKSLFVAFLRKCELDNLITNDA